MKKPIALLVALLLTALLLLPALAEEAPATPGDLPAQEEPDAPADETPADPQPGTDRPDEEPASPETEPEAEPEEEDASETLQEDGLVGVGKGTSELAIDINDGKKTYTFNTWTVTKVTCAKKYLTVTLNSAKPKTFTIEPLKVGSSKITVYYTTTSGTSGKATYTVTVSDRYLADSITLAETGKVTVLLGKTYKPSYTISPSTAQSKTTVTWKLANSKYATIDASTGVVTPVKEGTVKLTVTTANGKKSTATLNIVDPYKVTELTLNYTGTVKWPTTKALTLSYTAETWGGVSKYPVPSGDLTWSSGNTKVATIDAKGKVTVNKAGKVVFTLKSARSGKTAKVTFQFIETAPLKSITLSPTAVELRADTKSSKQLKATLTPSNAELLVDLTWSSSKPAVATVDENGKVTAVDEGTTIITCKDKNSGIYKTVLVTVSWPATYRALLCVEPTEVSATINGYECTGYYKRSADLSTMQTMLKKQNFDGQKYSIKSLHSSSASTVLSAIDALAGTANEHDVTLFYFMGHGGTNGYLYFYNGTSISPSTLKTHLGKIPGKVIVLLGACYSGRYITKDGESTGSASSFNSAILSTFGTGETIPLTILDSDGNAQPVTKEHGGGGLGRRHRAQERRADAEQVLCAHLRQRQAGGLEHLLLYLQEQLSQHAHLHRE